MGRRHREAVARKRAEWPDVEPTPWTCPQCETVTVIQELAPRCPVCGYRESSD